VSFYNNVLALQSQVLSIFLASRLRFSGYVKAFLH